jgi:hypothetical protein
VDTVNNQINSPLSHFNTCAVLYLAPKVTPANFTMGNVTISPSSAKVGEAISISTSVANSGGTDGKYTLQLKINEVHIESREVSLEPGITQIVQFSLTRDTPGDYVVDINGAMNEFKIAQPVSPTPASPTQITSSTPASGG